MTGQITKSKKNVKTKVENILKVAGLRMITTVFWQFARHTKKSILFMRFQKLLNTNKRNADCL